MEKDIDENMVDMQQQVRLNNGSFPIIVENQELRKNNNDETEFYQNIKIMENNRIKK